MKNLLVLALILALTSACSDDSAEPNGSPNNTTATNANSNNSVTNPFISGNVTGDVESTLALVGFFKCQSTGIPGQPSQAELIGTRDTEQVSIFLPYTMGGQGTFQLIGRDDDPARVTGRTEISYRSPDVTSFDSGSGTLTITAWPMAVGESIQATFEASLTNNDGTQNVELSGTIDGTASESGLEDCE